jgi:hypothetical protein
MIPILHPEGSAARLVSTAGSPSAEGGSHRCLLVKSFPQGLHLQDRPFLWRPCRVRLMGDARLDRPGQRHGSCVARGSTYGGLYRVVAGPAGADCLDLQKAVR